MLHEQLCVPIQEIELETPLATLMRIGTGPQSLKRSDMSPHTAYTRLATAAASDEVQAEINSMATTEGGAAMLTHWSQQWVDDGYMPPWEAGTQLTLTGIARMLKERDEARRDPFDLETARDTEVKRWLKLIGPLANQPYDYDKARDRSRVVGVPFKEFNQKVRALLERGEAGLRPEHWEELDEKSKAIALGRLGELGDLATAEFVDDATIEVRAIELGWRTPRLKEQLQRYRAKGLWGLAPSHNPRKERRITREERIPRAYGTLNAKAVQTMFERLDALGHLASTPTATDAEVEARAAEVGRSPRTLWEWRGYLRDFGLIGLAPLLRSDKHKHHNLSDDLVLYIEGVRVAKLDRKDDEVYSIACREARRRGELEPTPWQVRSICANIPKGDKLIADRREREFRNKLRFTGPIDWNKSDKVVWQIDHTPVDVLVKDCRRQQDRAKSGETRLFLTACKDAKSGIVLAARFTYERPDRFVIAAVIRDAILLTDTKAFGGIPDEIWVDRGKEMISELVQTLCRALSIRLRDTRRPELKGKVERLFRTLNTLLWSRQPGYVNSNITLRNPNAAASLLPEELIARFWTFIERYNNYLDKRTQLTRLDYWYKHCPTRDLDEPRLLDMLLMDAKDRKMGKTSFSYEGASYTHKLLSDLTGEYLTIRATPYLDAPLEVEVFYDDEWICTAFKMDEATGAILDGDELREAQRAQRAAIIARNDKRRAAFKQSERAAAREQKVETPAQPSESSPPSRPSRLGAPESTDDSDILQYATEADGFA